MKYGASRLCDGIALSNGDEGSGKMLVELTNEAFSARRGTAGNPLCCIVGGDSKRI